MAHYKTWQDLLKNTSYKTKDKYMGKEIYPNTGNINVDWQILQYTISILSGPIKNNSIEEYFYWLSFMNQQAISTGIKELEKNLPDVYEMQLKRTNNFVVRGNLGSIVPGYNLIIPKNHHRSMSALPKAEKEEYIKLLEYVRNLFIEIYNKPPIIFEHGTNNSERPKASSIVHSHTHIVNHTYTDEQKIIDYLGLEEVGSIEEMLKKGQNKNYISYISPQGKYYIAETSKEESQIMRRFIAEDIGKPNEWDWKEHPHLENSFETAKQYFLYQQKGAK